ncbi:hypothetical protein ACSMXM_05370 [Pacificimonas sp. ICDLI1SI03]
MSETGPGVQPKPASFDWFDVAVGMTAMVGGLGLLSLLIFFEVPEGSRDAVLLGTGLCLGWGGSVVSNRFGSSKGSERKTELMGMK